MNNIVKRVFLAFTFFYPTTSLANTPQQVAAIAHAAATAANASGQLPLHVQPGLMITEYESSGEYLIINAEMTKNGLSGLGGGAQMSSALRQIAVQRFCSNPDTLSLLKTGLIVRSNYRMEGSRDVIMTYDVSQKSCETGKNLTNTEKNIHDYLVANLNLEKQHMPELGFMGKIVGADVVGNTIVYKIILKEKTTIEKFKDQSQADRFRDIFCKIMHGTTIFQLGAGVSLDLYSDPNTKLREIKINSSTCGTTP
ncbi:hypothetical protein [Acetobacter malorum]|nr:hypothetical protein [Acetobacter malorum]